jgi:hypothetical protein
MSPGVLSCDCDARKLHQIVAVVKRFYAIKYNQEIRHVKMTDTIISTRMAIPFVLIAVLPLIKMMLSRGNKVFILWVPDFCDVEFHGEGPCRV